MTKLNIISLLKFGASNVSILTVQGLDTFKFDLCDYLTKSMIY